MSERSFRLDDAAGEWVETHISRVLLTTDEVFKIKKPVDLGFVDFSTLERRLAACRAEVELNRRLAPDVYLGLRPVTRDAEGRRWIDGPGDIVDWAVHMRRLPDAWRADVLLAQGRLGPTELESIARRIARFHAGVPVVSTDHIDALRTNVTENFDQSREFMVEALGPDRTEELEHWQHRFIETHLDLLQSRAEAGYIRDGHGDLRLEHVYIHPDGGVLVLDCVEFSERLRVGDVASDVAFFSMDLAFNGRVDLAELFLSLYARESNDYGMYELVDLHESYRAHVRGKIASFLARDESVPVSTRERAATTARRYLTLATSAGRTGVIEPMVVAVGGPIACGKSTVAAALGVRMGAPVVVADRTRKHLAGVDAFTPLADGTWSGAYSPDMTRRVYEELMRRATSVLRSGRPVILDATFRSRALRELAADLARRFGVPFWFVECRAPAQVLRERLEARARDPSVSDGRVEILDEFLAAWERVDELPESRHVVLDTTRPLERTIQDLAGLLPVWPDLPADDAPGR